MASYNVTMIKNGNSFVPIYVYKCKICDKNLPESNSFHVEPNGDCYCGDCAFKNGLISDKEYIKNFLYFICLPNLRVSIKDGEIHVTNGKFPWEINSRNRNSPEYKKWRNKVFERDKYTCQKCNKIGGTLNAHHIKEYSKYPEVRYEVKNGITLCEKCHKKIHRKKV